MDRHDPEPTPDVATGASTPPSGDPAPTSPPDEPSPPQYDRLGRRLSTWEELPAKVRLRVEFEGKWVAWSADGEHVVAAADTFAEIHDAPERRGVAGTYCEWLEPDPQRRLGL